MTDSLAGRRRRMLALLALAELFGMAVWFAGNAVASTLGARWSLDADAVGWLATSVQLGFVAGTAVAALLNLADTLPSRLYFAAAAVLAGVFNGLVIAAPNHATALVLRFLCGACLAGVYPPAMKMISTWFDRGRGVAIGTIVGALTAGKALPYLLLAFPGAGAEHVLLGASALAWVAALLVVFGYRDGPIPFPRRAFAWSLVGRVWRVPAYRRVLGGYCGHMWELYSFWVWIPAFLAASLAGTGASRELVSALAFLAIAVGAAGCVWGGAIADRVGYARLVTWAMGASAACALLTPLAFGRSAWLLSALVVLWGITVIADSAQFSTLVTRLVPSDAVGTALTLQTSIGFLLTTISIQLVPVLEGRIGWRWTFPMLAIGPLLGILAIRGVRERDAVPSRAVPSLES